MHIHLICADARIDTEYLKNLAAVARGDTLFGAMSEEQGYKRYVEDTKKHLRNNKFISDNQKMGYP